MKAIKLKTEHMVNPIGLQTANPILSWVCEGGAAQTAYQIIATSNGEVVWDSGKVPSSKMQVRYGGPAAKPRQQIQWSVTLWDEKDDQGETETASFEMGLTDGSWAARWIDPECPHEESLRQPSSVLRRTFTAPAVKKPGCTSPAMVCIRSASMAVG